MNLTETMARQSFWEMFSLKDENIYIPLIFTCILIATSFKPLLQVILVELPYLYAPASKALNIEVMPIYLTINSIISLAIIYFFYQSQSLWGIITTNLFAVIFFYPMLILLFHGLENIFPLLLAGLIFGIVFIGVAIFKTMNINSKV